MFQFGGPTMSELPEALHQVVLYAGVRSLIPISKVQHQIINQQSPLHKLPTLKWKKQKKKNLNNFQEQLPI